MAEDKSTKSEAALREEETLKFWQDNKIFEKTLEKDSPKGEYVFYDGPPFATGLPHYGHIVASVIKDAIPRYWTMKGYKVPRLWGWDCHGLPIENIVEKELGFKHKKDIKEYGIDKFNERCREQVLTYAHEWEKLIPRIGRWADMEHAYKTMDKPFMESVWWVFKQLYDKGLVYEDYRSMHICPRCETTLSQQEVAEGYKNVKDISVTVKFKLKNPEKLPFTIPAKASVFMLAWTTTPWTLPGNVALAVNNEVDYRPVLDIEKNEVLIVSDKYHASNVHGMNFAMLLLKNDSQVLKGRELCGLEYEPLYDYYSSDENLKNRENGWKVYAADFVTEESGTGIAHEAPAFGAEDWELLKQVSLPFVQHVGMDGAFKPEVKAFAGMQVKPKEDPSAADVEVIKDLAHRGLLFAKEKIEHSYPHCWRCDMPLLNYATSSWFVSVTKIKDQLLESAKDINWSPAHIKEGRFGKWLEGARDWSISRQRFWASCIPMWVCGECKLKKVFGSATELEAESGQKVEDLHKHFIDKIELKCACGGVMRRIPDVLDTWFDSGSMPYGQVHYPFENKERFENTFPAEFIGEGLDQTRAWFYYLHVLAGGLFGKGAFKNVIVNGIVLAEDGQKMSKKLKNYPDPSYVVDKYSADTLRYYLLSSSVVSAEDLSFSEKGLDEVVKKVFNPLNNVYSFYELYRDKGLETNKFEVKNFSVLDKWIWVRTINLTQKITEYLDNYKLAEPMREIRYFIDDLSTWYLRRSREQIKAGDENAKKRLFFVLRRICNILAPFAPFITEDLYQKLRHEGEPISVHLTPWSSGDVQFNDADEILENMAEVRRIVSVALEKRNAVGIKVRQPLAKLKVKIEKLKGKDEYLELIKDEVNIKEVEFDVNLAEEVELDTEITEELKKEGEVREVIRAIQAARKEANLTPDQKVKIKIIAQAETLDLVKLAQGDISKPTGVSEIGFEEGQELRIEIL